MIANPPDTLDPQFLELILDEHDRRQRPRHQRLWAYYRNLLPGPQSGPSSPQAPQAEGLPDRLRLAESQEQSSREIVLENDIAWRIHTLADFMFARPVTIQSLASDPDRAKAIEALLAHIFHANGGICFFQNLALLGSVYGFVDILLRLPDQVRSLDDFRLDTIEAPRAIPVLHNDDYRKLDAYALNLQQQTQELETRSMMRRVRDHMLGHTDHTQRKIVEHTHVWTAQHIQHYVGSRRENPKLVDESINRLGRLPVVHIQNLPQPFFYEGLSEVEPLIPLQNELNTRLSDRANRVTFQSFKMYLGKGIDGFHERPVGPGQMWSTDNANATIQEFGGDGASPSEEAHILEIREALDKTSGVSPVATGVIRGKLGKLTSENAIRIVMMGLLAKTEKKRVTYGQGLMQLVELILHAADLHGLLPNDPEDRRIRLDWPNPMPDSETQRLRNAKTKLELGVSQKQVLAELGYHDLQAVAD